MTSDVLKNLKYIWTNQWWYVSLCIGFLINFPFSVNTEYFLTSLKSWGICIVITSVFLAMIGTIYSKDGK